MPADNNIYIGTSGWQYDHWKGPFYPDDISSDDMLDFYRQHLSTVEVNNTFYQLPSDDKLAAWSDTVPEHFLFAVKASRYITHMKKLKDGKDSSQNFFARIDSLGTRLGPVLFQLPPNWHCNPDRLQEFLDILPDCYRYTFEFRDTSWFDDEILDLLRAHDAAFCIYELGDTSSPLQVTTDFVYIRLHGPDGDYQGSYSDEQLGKWHGHIKDWHSDDKTVYCYFDNDEQGFAVDNAQRLRDML